MDSEYKHYRGSVHAECEIWEIVGAPSSAGVSARRDAVAAPDGSEMRVHAGLPTGILAGHERSPEGWRASSPPRLGSVAMKRLCLLASLIVLAGTGAAKAEPPSPTGALVVRVATGPTANGATPRAVPGAVVVVSDERGERKRASESADGSIRLADLPEGDYTLRVDADRFVGEEQDVTVEAGKEATASFVLSPGVPFDGTVVDEETEKPIAGAIVAVEARGSVAGFTSAEFRAPYARAISDAAGRFHVNGVPDGKVATVEVSATGHAAGAFALRILGGQVTPSPVVVRLARGGTVVGFVRGPDGKPVVGATVYVIPAAVEELRQNPHGWRISESGVREQAATATSGVHGAYHVAGLALDVEYVAVAEAEGFASSPEVEGLSLAKDRPEAVANLVLRAAATLRVRLVDLAGKRIPGGVVELGASPGPTVKKDEPDASDRYEFSGLAPGKWPVSVTAPGFRPTWTTAVVEAGQTTEVTIRLDPGASIEGIVVDDQGKPVAGATVYVETVGGNDPGPNGWTTIGGRKFKAGPDGRFAATGLPTKDADVTAQMFVGPEKNRWATAAALRVHPPARDVRLVLVAGGTASLRLLTPDGKPFTGLATIMDGKKHVSRSGGPRTIKDGMVRVTGLDDGDYEIFISLSDYLNVYRAFRGRPRVHTDLGTVTLDPGLVVSGRVVDLSGAPVPGARVSGSESSVAADERGAFVLPHEPRGKIRVSAEADGFVGAGVDVTVVPGLASIEVRLPRGGLVKAVVRDADGALSQEDVFIWRVGADGKRLDDEEEVVTPGEDGSFAHRLAPGSYRFVARATGKGATPPTLLDVTLAEGDVREVVLKLPR